MRVKIENKKDIASLVRRKVHIGVQYKHGGKRMLLPCVASESKWGFFAHGGTFTGWCACSRTKTEAITKEWDTLKAENKPNFHSFKDPKKLYLWMAE